MQAYETTTSRLQVEELGSCALVQDLLPLYLEGEVSPGSRDLITEHLARCERCAGFLAGAQSARAQLRREQIQRSSAVAASAPESRAVSRLSRVLGGVALLFCCLLGGGMAAAVGTGLFYGDPGSFASGMLGSALIVALLAWLGRSYGPVSPQRFMLLLGGCALGGMGGLLLSAPVAGGAAVV
ncbi:MAG TPA: anti-sigma factor, partial [Chloroflexaceae bacterium]|nr:anti-sigma factor [Chloroflexaceae bacterium]